MLAGGGGGGGWALGAKLLPQLMKIKMNYSTLQQISHDLYSYTWFGNWIAIAASIETGKTHHSKQVPQEESLHHIDVGIVVKPSCGEH